VKLHFTVDHDGYAPHGCRVRHALPREHGLPRHRPSSGADPRRRPERRTDGARRPQEPEEVSRGRPVAAGRGPGARPRGAARRPDESDPVGADHDRPHLQRPLAN